MFARAPALLVRSGAPRHAGRDLNSRSGMWGPAQDSCPHVVRKQSPATVASASPWWPLGSASGDAIDGARDRSRGQGVAGAAARRRCCHAIPTARRVPLEAAASGRVRKRRVGAAPPRIGTSQAWNLSSQACSVPSAAARSAGTLRRWGSEVRAGVCTEAVEPCAHRSTCEGDLPTTVAGRRSREGDAVDGRPAEFDPGSRGGVASDRLSLLEDAAGRCDVGDLLCDVLNLARVGPLEQLPITNG